MRLKKINVFSFNRKCDLLKYEMVDNLYIIKDLLEYYRMVSYYDGIRRILNRTDLKSKDDETNELINYYSALLFHFEKKNYYAEKIVYKLPDYYKILFEIHIVENIKPLSDIFEKRILPNYLEWLKKNKVLTFELYFCYYVVNKKSIKKIEKEMKKYTLKLLQKNEIDFYIFSYLIYLLNVFCNMYYLIDYNSEIYYLFINKTTVLKKILKIVNDNICKYKEILNDNFEYYNNINLYSVRLLMGLSDDENEIKEYIDYIENNISINESGKFLLRIAHTSSDEYRQEDFINGIKEEINLNNVGGVFHLLNIYSEKRISKQEQNSLIDELNVIKRKAPSFETEINVGIEIIKFWNGEKFNYNVINENYRLDNFLMLLIQFDNNIISYDTFLSKLMKINKIDATLVNNWERIFKIFENRNLDWLVFLLINTSKISINDNDFLNMINKLLNSILVDKKMAINLSDFRKLEMAINTIDSERRFLSVIVMIYITKYQLFDDRCKQLIKISMTKEIDDVIRYANVIVQIMIIENDYSMLSELLFYIKDKIEEKDYYIIYAATIYGNVNIEKNDYIKSINTLDECLNGIIAINENDYRIIGNTCEKLLQKEIISDLKYGTIYCFDNRKYVSSFDYIEELDKVYIDNNVEKNDKFNKINKDNLCTLLLQKLFFQKIELFGAGKTFSISSNLNGEDLLRELAKITNLDKINEEINKIENGKMIVAPWFNVINTHIFFKEVKKGDSNIFINTTSKYFDANYFILHLSSIIVLGKLDLLNVVKNDEYLLILKSFEREISQLEENEYFDYSDIINNSLVAYDDLLKKCYVFVKDLDNKKIVDVPTANILGLNSTYSINIVDRDIFKYAVMNESDFKIVADDPFYLYENPFNNVSYSTFSYIVSLYERNLIDSDKLLTSANSLNSFNYSLNSDRTIYNYLLSKSNDKNIKQVVRLINEQRIKK